MKNTLDSIIVHYYITKDIQLNDFIEQNERRLLDEDTLKKIKSYRKEADARMCLLSYLIKSNLLQSEKKGNPSCQLCYSPYGKPYLQNSQIHFNISHHSDIVAIAMSNDLKVGVDVIGIPHQSDNSIKCFLSLMQSNLHENELRYIRMFKSLQQQIHYFYIFWALKEAYLKAIGVGIGHSDYPLCSFDFSSFSNNSHCTIHTGYWNNQLLDDVFVALSLQPSVILAIATSSELCNGTKEELSISDIVLNDRSIYYSQEGNCSICIAKKNCDNDFT